MTLLKQYEAEKTVSLGNLIKANLIYEEALEKCAGARWPNAERMQEICQRAMKEVADLNQ